MFCFNKWDSVIPKQANHQGFFLGRFKSLLQIRCSRSLNTEYHVRHWVVVPRTEHFDLPTYPVVPAPARLVLGIAARYLLKVGELWSFEGFSTAWVAPAALQHTLPELNLHSVAFKTPFFLIWNKCGWRPAKAALFCGWVVLVVHTKSVTVCLPVKMPGPRSLGCISLDEEAVPGFT